MPPAGGAAGLWELAQHIDGHFLPYYAFMHLWLEFGQAEWWMRLPSALATGAAAVLVADLGRRLHSLPAGLPAAAVYVDRYLFATVPAYALLAGLALASLPRAAALLAPAGLVAGAVPGHLGHLDLRRPDGRHENFPRAVRIVEQGARPGDAIVYGRSRLREGFLYYGGERLPDDVLLSGTAPLPDSFGYPERDDVAAAVGERRRVWVVWPGGPEATARAGRVDALVGAGFTRVKAWRTGRVPGMTVALYARRPPSGG
ncbi:hypothetical protein [Planomonospora sp. ID91781]|uniref:hypothetical protein n=1 Tax=Planomonospora sp. ID91781 TaxID=2738135 RepID=UPI0018C3F885|nr:hypothetical protein [Planomonospora sp. ID91781]